MLDGAERQSDDGATGDTSPGDASPSVAASPEDERRALLERKAKQARDRRALKKATATVKEQRAARVVASAEGTPAQAPASPGDAQQVADASALLEPCRQLWTAASAVGAGQYKALELQAAEIEQLAKLSAPVAAKYLPEVAASPEAMLIGTIAMVYLPRVIQVLVERQELAAKANKAGAAGGATP